MNAVSNPSPTAQASDRAILQVENLSVSYGHTPALAGVTMDIYQNRITGFIGASGCGKSTLLRCFNRLTDLLPMTRVTGKILFDDRDLHTIHPVEVRRRIGMVFQRPNPFPKSVYDNIAVGLRVNGYKGDIEERVESTLKQVGLWEEVKNSLRKNALDLSGGQQQRLCIARAIALDPEILLMDEPTASLDPVSAARIDDLLMLMKQRYTILLVTHNLKQAALVADRVAFLNVEIENGHRVGKLIEYASAVDIFVQPTHPETWDYVVPGARFSRPHEPPEI